ncbi:alpha/beta hydrolase [Leifsonia sp. 2MCAF36]|uniref:alpha/beta hydrolase n=1 Tax=Leifsonia sp. 2MCAF36 TaxID=3232988 RepID=UPI003F949AA2
MSSVHIIVLPGSGYQRHAPHEGEPVAQWLRTLGYEATVLWYPVPARHPAPLHAVEGRIAELRAEGVKTVVLLGFSAGGHLAGQAALTLAEPTRPDAVVLAYPVVSMMTEHHAISRENLLGRDATEEERRAASLELLARRDAPPFFIWHTAEDASVPLEHSLRLAHALSVAEVDFELHVYRAGKHGVGLAEGIAGTRDWTELCARWLSQTLQNLH